MKKSIISTITFFLLIISFSLQAQKTSRDSIFKPSGKLWGLAFMDYYYKSHADFLGRGSYQYSRVAKNSNAFQYRRIYLGYNYNINPKFSVELVLAAENDYTSSSITGVNTGFSGDVLQDNNLSPYIKFANLRWKNIWRGTDMVVGEQSTPLGLQVAEPAWDYRNIEKTVADLIKGNNYDAGVSLQGRFDPRTNNFGFDAMIGNGNKSMPESDNYKWFYSDVWGKFMGKKLWIDLYADYNKIGYTGSTLNYPHSRNMFKVTLAYVTETYTIGVESYINYGRNDVEGVSVNGVAKDTTELNAVARAISIYAHGWIIKNLLGYFVRYDNFDPDSKYNTIAYITYLAPPNNVFNPNTTTQFITGGLDFTPTRNVHIEPNIWYVRYANQQAGLMGAALHDYDLVWRMTFYFVFR